MSAIISKCGRYRYRLERKLQGIPKFKSACVFIMLNPSTADAELDDPTIRRCKGFAERFSCDTLVVVNLFAFRATKPAVLYKAKNLNEMVGPENDKHILAALNLPGMKICGWGANNAMGRDDVIRRLAATVNVGLTCLGKTQSGAPRHPLFVSADAPLEVW